MNPPVYLSRVRLRHDASVAAIRPLLAPSDESARVSASHRLVWSLFADTPDRKRDFLWREAQAGIFYVLSRRVPTDAHGLFEVEEPKAFEPSFRVGDRLGFALRANATVARGGGPGRRGKPCDVVMDALHRAAAPHSRAEERRRVMRIAGLDWLARQGERNGFSFVRVDDTNAGDSADAERSDGVRVTGYRTLRLDRPGGSGTLGVLDFEGVLEVRDPPAFVGAIESGFGRAKAFGFGLMMVRRV